MIRVSRSTGERLGAAAAVLVLAGILLAAWWPAGGDHGSSTPTTSAPMPSIDAGARMSSPPALSTTDGELVAVGMQSGTRYAFRLRIDATGITKCTEPTPWPDHADCLNNGSSELPVLAVYGPAAQRWVWTTVPSHQATSPQLWVHHGDGTLTVVPLEAHGRLAWPAAAVLLRGDERSAELRDGTTVLDSLFLPPAHATTTTSTLPVTPIALLGAVSDGRSGFVDVRASQSTDGTMSLCISNGTTADCRSVDPGKPSLTPLPYPGGAPGIAVVGMVPVALTGVAQLVTVEPNGATSVSQLAPYPDIALPVALAVTYFGPGRHGRTELRIGPTIAAMLGAEG